MRRGVAAVASVVAGLTAVAAVVAGLTAIVAVVAALTAAQASARPLPLSTFHSVPGLRPPKVFVSGKVPDPGAGDIFADAQNSIQAGPLILDPNGKLLWFDALPNRGFAHDVKVQSYQGQSVLTFWESYAGGVEAILNHSYQQIATVYAGNGYTTGNHEFEITPQGTALILAYRDVTADLRPVGGKRRGKLIDQAIQEVDIANRPGAVAVGRARSHPPGGHVSRESRISAVRLPPHELDPAAAGRQPPRLCPPHLGRLRDQQADGKDRVDPGRQALDLQDRSGSALPLAARRANAGRRHDHHVRQRRRPISG